MTNSPYSTAFSIGFGPRMNRITRFRELYDLCRTHQGIPKEQNNINPDWVGAPLAFYVPALSCVPSKIGQSVAVRVYSLTLIILERNKDTIYIESGKKGSVNMAVSYAYGPDDYRLVLSSMFTDTNDGFTRRIEDLLVLPGTDDVEQLLSCYLSLCEMKKVDIRCIKIK